MDKTPFRGKQRARRCSAINAILGTFRKWKPTMTRAVLLVLLILSVAWLAQSGDGDEMQCPDKDANFFAESINAYFDKHPPKAGKAVTIPDGARYDNRTHWWIVPVDVGQERLQALLSCDGHLGKLRA
ncbi:hypothetical protein ALP14_100809, partial [Pseudomonas amygdali pv. myricae]